MAMDITIENLSFTYPSGVSALADVSLQIPAGQAVAIIGQNGAGKTTLVKHLIGLLKPSAGYVRVGERDTRAQAVAELAEWVGYVFQNPDDQLFKPTVWDEVTFGPRNLKWPEQRVEQSAREALHLVRLRAYLDRHPYDLSPSQRKKVALAAVLAMDTPVIILDEPTTGQDYASIVLFGEIVERLKTAGRTVITVTHDIDFCADHFERVVVMNRGRILLDGPAREVLSQASLLAEAKVYPPQIVRLALELGLPKVPLTVEEFIQILQWNKDAPSN